jgi:ADP-ribosylglycohydrolase
MYGALIGDIIGSRFEFCNLRFSQFGEDNINFELFEERCNFTDDSVMTIAVADALLTPLALVSERRFKSVLVNKMHSWALKYPGVGYGDRFGAWVLTKDK